MLLDNNKIKFNLINNLNLNCDNNRIIISPKNNSNSSKQG